jgi:membrane associated rhomboid family serine protease
MAQPARPSADSPTVVLVVITIVTFLLQAVTGLFGLERWLFVLAWPIVTRPWTVVTSVFAHADLFHLVANLVALVIGGVVLERYTTPARFYAFFLVTGALAGVAQILATAPLTAGQTAVIGSSGAVLAIFGYLAASNRVSDLAAAGVSLSPRARIALFTAIAALVTVATVGPDVALVGHFTGFLVGLVTGRAHVLRVR